MPRQHHAQFLSNLRETRCLCLQLLDEVAILVATTQKYNWPMGRRPSYHTLAVSSQRRLPLLSEHKGIGPGKAALTIHALDAQEFAK